MRLYFIGFMGAGKTHWGKIVSKKLGLHFIDMDEFIVQHEGRQINELFKAEGESYFRLKEKELLHQVTNQHTNLLLSCGGGLPCYHNNMEYMNAQGITVWLHPPNEILLGRLRKKKQNRPLIKDLDDEQLKQYIVTMQKERQPYYNQAKVVYDCPDVNVDELVKKIQDT